MTSAGTGTAKESDKIEPSNLTVDSGGALTSAHCLQKSYITTLKGERFSCNPFRSLHMESRCALARSLRIRMS